MSRRSRLPNLNRLILTSLVMISPVLTLANQCTLENIQSDLTANGVAWWNSEIDMGSYQETIWAPAPTGSVNPTWETIKEQSSSNCSSGTVSKSFSYTVRDFESIDHSVSGELKTEVGLKVGAKDKAEVGLGSAHVDTNGWKYIGSRDVTTTDSASASIAACKGLKYIRKGKRLSGSHSGQGHVNYTVNFRISFESWRQTSGECKSTTSSATGLKYHTGITESFTEYTPDCGTTGPCKKCKKKIIN